MEIVYILIFLSVVKPIFSSLLIYSKLNRVIPFLRGLGPHGGSGFVLASVPGIGGQRMKRIAILRLEEAVPGSAFGGRTSRGTASWTHSISVNRRRRGWRRRCTRPAFGGRTCVDPSRRLSRLPPRPFSFFARIAS